MARSTPSLWPRKRVATGWVLRAIGMPLLMSVGSACAQSGPPEASPKAVVNPTVQVQVVVIGQEVPPRYEYKRVIVQEIRRPRAEGEAGESEVVLPEQEHHQAPLQIAPEPDELPPGPLYVKSGTKWEMLPVRANNPTPKVAVPREGSVVIATRKETIGAGGKVEQSYTTVAEFPISESQESILVLLIKDPRQHLKWKINRTLAFDTSRTVMQPGSFNVINVAGLPVRAAVADKLISTIPPFRHASVQTKPDVAGVVPYLLEVQAPSGHWARVVKTGISMVEEGRIILISYSVVLPISGRLASVVTIRDEPQLMEFSTGNEAAPN